LTDRAEGRVTGDTSRRGRTLRSLAVHTALWYGALLAVCLVTYSVAVIVHFDRHVDAELDRQAQEDVELAERSIVAPTEGVPSWRGGLPPWSGASEEPGGGHWLELWDVRGERLLRDGTVLPVDMGPAPGAAEVSPRPRTIRLPSGRVRMLVRRTTIDGRPFLLRVGLSEESSVAQVRGLVWQMVALTIGVLAAGGIGTRWIAHRALGPLSRLAERAQRISAERLHERLPVEGSIDELDRLASSFNATLGRLEASFEQLKRFTADVSHELRTPLTALRSVGEVSLRTARDPDAYREVIGSMLEEVDRLTRLVDELLILARADAGESQLHWESADLAELARVVAGQLAVLAEEKEQLLEVEVPALLPLTGDAVVLRQALANLVVNAVRYSPPRTRIRIGAGRIEGAAYLEVRDEGPGIPEAHSQRVFERFYRIDKSRSREMGGTGLGLAVVKWAAEAHGGRVELESVPGRGSTFRILLPAQTRQPAAVRVERSEPSDSGHVHSRTAPLS
jgi:heavy metal sensor kinase